MAVRSNRRPGRTGVGSASLAQWLLDGLANWRERGSREAKRLQLIERLPLNGKGSLMLVSCGGREYLVGCGADSVETILCVERSESRGVLQQGMEL